MKVVELEFSKSKIDKESLVETVEILGFSFLYKLILGPHLLSKIE